MQNNDTRSTPIAQSLTQALNSMYTSQTSAPSPTLFRRVVLLLLAFDIIYLRKSHTMELIAKLKNHSNRPRSLGQILPKFARLDIH